LASDHPTTVICYFSYNGPTPNVPCGPNGSNGPPGGPVINGTPGSVIPSQSTPAALSAVAVQIAKQDYSGYTTIFLYPSVSLMIESGLWIELEAAIGFIVGLGLASLLGQRTVAVVLMIVLEIILTPLLTRTPITHLVNLQRAVVGLATAHLEPSGLPLAFSGGGGGPNGVSRASQLVPESTTVAICVIVAWLVGWSVLGAWRMMTRDA
jgi:hypothetical protein